MQLVGCIISLNEMDRLAVKPTQTSPFHDVNCFYRIVMILVTRNLPWNGYMSVFRQPRIHTGQYLDKYCFNQSESRKNINNPK